MVCPRIGPQVSERECHSTLMYVTEFCMFMVSGTSTTWATSRPTFANAQAVLASSWCWKPGQRFRHCTQEGCNEKTVEVGKGETVLLNVG